MVLGSRLRELRKERNLSQSDLGKLTGLTSASISAYEKEIRTPDLDTIKNFSKIFGVSVDYLVGNQTNSSDLKQLIKQNAMTYGGKEISEHDLKILEGVVNSILGGGANGDK